VLESNFAFFLSYENPNITIKAIRDRNLVHVRKNDLIQKVEKDDFLNHILSKYSKVDEIIALIDDVLKELKIALASDRKRHLELEQLLAMTQVIHSLKELLHAGEEVQDLRTMVFLLRQLLPLKKLDFIGEPVNGLQIMGLLETRGLDYKNVIMLSVNEGVLPAGKTVTSYIPHDMKRKFQLPTYSEKDSVYAYHFYRLLHRVSNACFIYNTEKGKIGGSEKSRFLTQLSSNDQVAHDIVSNSYIYKNTAAIRELMTIEKNDSYFTRLHEIAGTGFSPSALTSYVRNPLDFYAQKILKIPQVEEVEESMALNTMGSIIHEALDQLYRPQVNKVLAAPDFIEMKSRLISEVDKSFKLYYPSRSKPAGRNKIIYEVAAHYVKMMLAQDQQLVKDNHELIIKSVERELKATIKVKQVGIVHLHGKVDRIDQLDGLTRIIDYKTGAVERGEVGIEVAGYGILNHEYKKAKAFQVLMYALLYAESESSFTEVAAGIISFKRFKNGFVPFSIKEGRSYKLAMIDNEVLAQFKQELSLLIQELFDPNIPITEKDV
jgi:ATP-dependent helicase/DNAse subunit B